MKRIRVLLLVSIVAVMLSGCTMPEWFNNARTTTNAVDTGNFDKVIVTYTDKKIETYKNVKVYPYNNGGTDSTGGKVEIRQGSKVIILPDDAKIELQK